MSNDDGGGVRAVWRWLAVSVTGIGVFSVTWWAGESLIDWDRGTAVAVAIFVAGVLTSPLGLWAGRDTTPSAESVQRPFSVGEGDGGMRAQFVEAYQAAGGTRALGHPKCRVEAVGPGFMQLFSRSDGSGIVVLCALPNRPCVVIPGEYWEELSWIGGGLSGLDLGGFPVSNESGTLIIGGSATDIELSGGVWGLGRLTRTSVGEPWNWTATPTLNFEQSHNHRWDRVGSGYDVRARAVADFAWIFSKHEMEMSRIRRDSLLNELHATAFAAICELLMRRYGVYVQSPRWDYAEGQVNFNGVFGPHYRATLTAPDGQPALTSDIIVQVPDGRDVSVALVCLDVQISYAGWRAMATQAGVDLGDEADLRVSLLDVIGIFAIAWNIVADELPRAFIDRPERLAAARPPYVEMHLQAGQVPSGSTRTLDSVVDLAVLGRTTQNVSRSETGMRVYGPTGLGQRARLAFLADGFAKLGLSWGNVQSDADTIMLELTRVANAPDQTESTAVPDAM